MVHLNGAQDIDAFTTAQFRILMSAERLTRLRAKILVF